MGRPISNVASRIAGKRLPWVPVLVIAVVLMAAATARAETGRITLKVTDNDILVLDAEVTIHTPSGESLDMRARTNKAGSATFVAPAGSYKFCVDHCGERTWSHVVHTLPNEETEVRLVLEQLAADKTLDPHPARFDGTPPEKEPVMLASLAGLSGILTQSTVAAVSKDRLYWFVNDHLGTPMMIVDENQEVVWQGSARPFGETAITVNTIENNFRFPGQYFDAESGLHYNYYRYYDNASGRYFRTDPLGLGAGINLYSYAQNVPNELIDPLGLETTFRQKTIGGALGISGQLGIANAKTDCKAGSYFEADYLVFALGGTVGIELPAVYEGLNIILGNHKSLLDGIVFSTDDDYPPLYTTYLDIEGHRVSFLYSAALGDIKLSAHAGGRADVKAISHGYTGGVEAQIFKLEGVHLIRKGKARKKDCECLP